MSMDLYLRREKGTISGVIHDKRVGKGVCISGLDQLLLYLGDATSEEKGRLDAGAGKKHDPELPEMSESFARIPSKDVKKLELQVTGGKHKTLQGQIYPDGEEPGKGIPFVSDLELLKRIHQLV